MAMTHPSQTADAQARKRARRRYPEQPDSDGFFVRGRKEPDGSWTSVPCTCADCLRSPAPATAFTTAEEGVQHELVALQARRATWANLAPEQQALGAHVSAEHDATRDVVAAEAEATREELRTLKRGRYIEVERASSKQLQAEIHHLQHAKRIKAQEEQAQRAAAKADKAPRAAAKADKAPRAAAAKADTASRAAAAKARRAERESARARPPTQRGAAAPSAAAELADGDRGARRAARRTARRSARRADETRVLVHAFDFESTVDIPLTTDAFDVPANVGTVGDVLTLWRQKYSEWPELEIEWDGKIVESTSDVLTVWRQKYRAPPEVKIEFDGEIVVSAMSLASLAQGSRKPLYKVASVTQLLPVDLSHKLESGHVMRLLDDDVPHRHVLLVLDIAASFSCSTIAATEEDGRL